MTRVCCSVWLLGLLAACGGGAPEGAGDVTTEAEVSLCEETHICDPREGCSNPMFSNQPLCEENGGVWGAITSEAACLEAGFDWVHLTTEVACRAAGFAWDDPERGPVSSWGADASVSEEVIEPEPEPQPEPEPEPQPEPEPEPEPEADVVGPDALTDDDAGPLADVTEEVVAANEPPLAIDDHAAVFAGEVLHIEVRANDSDPEGGPVSIVATTDGAYGAVSVSDGGVKVGERVTYTPYDATSLGIDTFTYTISDPEGLEATATVTVNQVESADAPILTILSPQHGEVIESDTVTIRFEAPGCYFTSPSVDPEGCHGHKWLDGEEWSDMEGGGVGHYTTSDIVLGPLTDGVHTMELVLHKNDGTDAVWDPEVKVQVSFEIQGGYTPPFEPVEPVVTSQEIISMQPAPDAGELLLGTAAGVYKTQGQTSLVPVFFGPRMSAMTRDPFSVSTYYASGQWPEAQKELWGLATSVNGGQSWVETGLVNEAMFEDLAVATDAQGTLAGVWASQLYLSQDGGQSWSTSPLTSWVNDLVFQSTEPTVLLLAGPSGIEALNLDDASATWLVEEGVSAIDRVGQEIAYVTTTGVIHRCEPTLATCTMGPTPSTDTVIQLASELADPQVLYLLTQTSQVFRSPDGGVNWELLIDGGP